MTMLAKTSVPFPSLEVEIGAIECQINIWKMKHRLCRNKAEKIGFSILISQGLEKIKQIETVLKRHE